MNVYKKNADEHAMQEYADDENRHSYLEMQRSSGDYSSVKFDALSARTIAAASTSDALPTQPCEHYTYSLYIPDIWRTTKPVNTISVNGS